jgi:membrane-associated phospholipid phosphatase
MRFVLSLAFLLLAVQTPAHAQFLSKPQARFFSSEGNVAFLVAGAAITKKPGVSSVALASLAAETLKRLTREKRPDTNERNSFPSGHAAAAFAIADQAARTHPRDAAYWYLGATLIADSRVRLNRHYPHDVVAGALLGIFVSRLSLKIKL